MSETTPLSFFEEDVTEEINHGIRVSNLAYYVGKELGLYENQCYELAVAGMVHDIGKLCVSGYLYGRHEDTLKIEEMKYVRMHPRLGYDLLMRYDFSDDVIETILYHHENYDGSGYPENLSGDQIPLGARILRVCDVYAALTSDRPYRRAFDADAAVELMIDEVKNFDIKVFLAFQRVIHEEQLADKWAIQRLKVRITEEDMK
ncbi:HD domain-containing protein [Anaerosacchariphilus sp. NSJ-68]|uniref:HD domain-containing protein n=2 Tax=Lachnospiraceae TaxID=186803 RepID=A0A923LAU7_9FIRM|nr:MULTISPECIES: HD domain-containing phosphohydrolase [Lachnospiraceae]MBC5658888.1 HD domain-containing protein [Anaerosacchariphilus hominis]MBC5698843.1 HD domain-containing protein [Roseburia difficilis]